jgi:hypothetical protein
MGRPIGLDVNAKPEHKIDLGSLDHDQREQLRVILLKAVGHAKAIDVEQRKREDRSRSWSNT